MFDLAMGAMLTVARLCLGGAVLVLTLASYAWWGNPDSALGRLAWPAGVLFVIGVVLVVAQRVLWLRHCRRERAIRRSTATNPKPV
ncbi:MAG: hypothetical protein KF858_01230 [Candidatus Sumerlaeia bacterium]|nr:hypothetical protein [Candidatus Sumerlaeia bacterium]